MAWISTANTLTIAAQMALPNWVRARGMSIYQMALMGGSAAGAFLWGHVAHISDITTSMVVASALGVCATLWLRRRPLDTDQVEDFSPAAVSAQPDPAFHIEPGEGPVMVTVEYLIDPARADEFAAVMQETRRARLRLGVLSWGLFRDSMVPGRYLEYFVDDSWLEHQRRLERFSASDAGLRGQRLSFHLGTEPPKVQRYVAEQSTLG